MRMMNLPPFSIGSLAGAPIRIEDLGAYLKQRLTDESMAWPDHSWRLIAHMAWPNDAKRRDLWMAAQVGRRLLRPDATSQNEDQRSAEDDHPRQPYLPAQTPSPGYFSLFGGHALLSEFVSDALHEEIGRIQHRWARIADILALHYDMSSGHYMRRRGGASVGKAIELVAKHSRVKGRSESSLWAIWGEFRDVAHLTGAAILLSFEAKPDALPKHGASRR